VIIAASLLAAAAAFNPVEFFRGRTHGEGTLKIIFQSAKQMSVDSVGRNEKDGSLLLEQVIHEPGKPPRTRYWHMRQTAPDRFEGTLTDAAGPVRVDEVDAQRSVGKQLASVRGEALEQRRRGRSGADERDLNRHDQPWAYARRPRWSRRVGPS
jgi:hypothetical protein